MKPSFRRLAEQMLPPFAYRAAAVAFHRARHDATLFSGTYANWDEVAAVASGYDSTDILEKARAAMRVTRADPDVFERDSVILPQPEYSFPALAALLWVASQRKDGLDIVDFGGSLGSSYFQFRRFLTKVNPLRWAVVEQPHFVQCGQEEFADDVLSFHHQIDDALGIQRRDILFASSVLQYLPDPHSFVANLARFDFEYILLDRTAFHEGREDRLTLQHNPTAIYRASYPAWFFAEARFLANFPPSYELVFAFDGRDQVHLAGGRPYYRGFLFKRIAPCA